jgi:hypothetical protein
VSFSGVFSRAAVLCALAPALAPAQFISMYGPQSNVVSAGLANMQYLMNNASLMMLRTQVYQSQRKAGQTAAAPPPARVRRPPGNFVFPYQGRLLSMDELAALVSSDEAARHQVARELGELVQTVAGDLGRDGSPYDMSKAFTLFTTTMYAVLNPGTPIPGRTMDRLRMQFRCEMLDEASMRGSPETLQKQWEALLAISGWTLMSYEMARTRQDARLAGSLREVARTGLQTVFRVDPAQLRIEPDSEWPLTVSAAAAPPPAEGWGQQAPRPAAGERGAPLSSQGWGSRQAATVASGSAVRIGHHHFLTGMHPASLRLDEGELVFDPEGHSCNQPRVSAPYSAIQVRDPAVNSNGELLLNLRLPDPRNPKKTLNLNFASGDSWVDESSGAPLVRSRAGAIDQLRELASELRRRGAK